METQHYTGTAVLTHRNGDTQLIIEQIDAIDPHQATGKLVEICELRHAGYGLILHHLTETGSPAPSPLDDLLSLYEMTKRANPKLTLSIAENITQWVITIDPHEPNRHVYATQDKDLAKACASAASMLLQYITTEQN